MMAGKITTEELDNALLSTINAKADIDTVNNLTSQISQKINTSAIVNNLTTGGISNVLSAEQGKVLNNNFTNVSIKANDWENFKANGGTINGGIINKTTDVANKNGIVRTIDNAEYTAYMRVGSGGQALFGLTTPTDDSNALVLETLSSKKLFRPFLANSVQLGTEDYKFMDIFLEGSSKTTNGYTKLSNGFILQWGSITNHVDGMIYLPISFPNNIVHLSGNILNSPDKWGGNLYLQHGNNSSFRAVVLNAPAKDYYIRWIAIGY